jgi:hypothetical protein
MDGKLVPYKDLDLRRLKAREYTAAYRARVKENASAKTPRYCITCDCDISHMRADARFCCRAHKAIHNDGNRNYKVEYGKNRAARRAQALKYYHQDIEHSRKKQLKRQKQNPSLYAAHTAKRRSTLIQRTPKWLTDQDFADIKKFYDLAHELSQAYGFPWHVDHIIPLKGKTVSGLHVVDNLQIMPANVNIAKSNRFEAA